MQIIKAGRFKELAEECVAFANAQGGTIIIGFDDKTHKPPQNQKIEQKTLNDTLERLRNLTFSVSLSASEILTHENGSEYFEITVSSSKKMIATTSDGKIFIRITDKCFPVHGGDIQRIAAEKDAFQWELMTRNVDLQSIPAENIERFVTDIRQSDRVKNSIKEKSNIEILEHYVYIYEFPDGLLRKQVRHYPKEVIRELLINAFAHKSYLISADIFIEAYPDRMTITSPGSLPMGVTKDNILHEKIRRNSHLIKILHDLKLMEAEGSGYDMIYEKLIVDAKELPVIESDFNKTAVSLQSKIINLDALRLTDYISQHYTLSSRDKIVLGIVARHQKILSTELVKVLQLSEDDRLKYWYTLLVEQKILLVHGRKKGTAFIINPKLLSGSKLNIKPTLKTMEPHRLKALVVEDLKIYPRSKSSEIQERIHDISIGEIRKVLLSMEKEKMILSEGAKKTKVYLLA